MNNRAFCHLFGAVFSMSVGFMLLVLLFKMARKHDAELLGSVSKYEKAVRCALWRTCLC